MHARARGARAGGGGGGARLDAAGMSTIITTQLEHPDGTVVTISTTAGQTAVAAATFPQGTPVTLTYWAIRGLAAPVRMMLSYAGVAFEEKRYVWAEAGDWFGRDKPIAQQRNALVNLPNIADGSGEVVTQSNAVLMYCARRTGLAGSDETQLTKVEQVLCDTYDLRDSLTNMVYWYKGFCRTVAEFEEQKSTYFEEKARQVPSIFFVELADAACM
jgi:hypothetical protein